MDYDESVFSLDVPVGDQQLFAITSAHYMKFHYMNQFIFYIIPRQFFAFPSSPHFAASYSEPTRLFIPALFFANSYSAANSAYSCLIPALFLPYSCLIFDKFLFCS